MTPDKRPWLVGEAGPEVVRAAPAQRRKGRAALTEADVRRIAREEAEAVQAEHASVRQAMRESRRRSLEGLSQASKPHSKPEATPPAQLETTPEQSAPLHLRETESRQAEGSPPLPSRTGSLLRLFRRFWR